LLDVCSAGPTTLLYDSVESPVPPSNFLKCLMNILKFKQKTYILIHLLVDSAGPASNIE
jgi:hypothetical protein